MKRVAVSESTMKAALASKYGTFCPNGFRGTISGTNWDIYGFLKYKSDGKCTFHKDLKVSSKEGFMCQAESTVAARICYCGSPPVSATPAPPPFVSGWYQGVYKESC